MDGTPPPSPPPVDPSSVMRDGVANNTSAEKPSYGVAKVAFLELGSNATNMAPVTKFTASVGAHINTILDIDGVPHGQCQ